MAADLHEFLSRDHERLDALLATCLRASDIETPGEPETEAYDQFRRGLLRHIAIEERVLFPLLRAQRGITPLEQQLHRDHAAIAALLVPPPTGTELRQIASILQSHNVLEEERGGLYAVIEDLAGDDLAALMARVHAIPAVRVVPNVDSPIVRSSIELLLREAEEGRAASSVHGVHPPRQGRQNGADCSAAPAGAGSLAPTSIRWPRAAR